jgi:nicotinamidase-related amidase
MRPWLRWAAGCAWRSICSRYAAELGYEVTVVKDATASYSDAHMHAALEVNLPNYAGAIVTTDEIVGTLSSLSGASLVDESILAIEM